MTQTSMFGDVSMADRLRHRGVEMDWYKKHPEDGVLPHSLQFKDLTPRQLRAINHMSNKGLVPQMSSLPNIRFKQLDTNEFVTFTIDDLLKEYDDDRKELARMRKAEKRIMANNARRVGS